MAGPSLIQRFSGHFARFATITGRLDRAVKRELASAGIPDAQQRLLCELLRTPGLTDAQVGERVGMKPAQTSPAMKKMIAAGWVAAVPSEFHKLQRHLSLTPEGEPVAQDIENRRTATLLREIDRLLPEERQMMFNAITGRAADNSSSDITVRAGDTLSIPRFVHAAQACARELRWSSDFEVKVLQLCEGFYATPVHAQGTYGWLAVQGQRVVGAALMTVQVSFGNFANLDDRPRIAWIYVSREYRNRGVGLKLLEHCSAIAEQHGEDTVAVDVPLKPAAALKLFKRRGFRTVGEPVAWDQYGKHQKWVQLQLKVK